MTNNTSKKTKAFRKYRIPFFSILFIIFCLIISASFILQSKLTDRLSQVEGIQFGQIKIPWSCQNVHITDLSFIDPIDESKHHSNCQSIAISGISWWRLWKDNKIIIDELTLKDGSSKFIHSNIFTDSDSIKKENRPDIFIKQFHFENMSIDFQKEGKFELEVQNFNGDFSEVNFKDNDIRYNQINIHTGIGNFKEIDSPYRLEWDSLNYGPEQEVLQIQKLNLQPIYSEKNWANHFNHKKSRLNLTVDEVNFHNFNLETLLYKKKIYADSLIVNNADLKVFVNNLEESCADCHKDLLHETFHNVKLPILIPNIFLRNNAVHIEVKSKKTEDVGKLSFNKIYASLYDVGNFDNQKIHVDLATEFMEQSNLSLQIDFDLTAPEYAYNVSGSLEPFDLTLINRFVYLTKRARIKSGQCSKLAFDFKGDNSLAEGFLIFEYKNLALELLDKKDGESKKLLSTLINKLGIISKNNPNDKTYRKGTIYQERLKNKGLFGQWWLAVQSGLKSVVLPKILLPKEIEAIES